MHACFDACLLRPFYHRSSLPPTSPSPCAAPLPTLFPSLTLRAAQLALPAPQPRRMAAARACAAGDWLLGRAARLLAHGLPHFQYVAAATPCQGAKEQPAPACFRPRNSGWERDRGAPCQHRTPASWLCRCRASLPFAPHRVGGLGSERRTAVTATFVLILAFKLRRKWGDALDVQKRQTSQ